jgi:hypothetical protein
MTIIFLHSPRTGGTSMAEILAQVYGPYSYDAFYSNGVWLVNDEGLEQLKKQKEYDGICIHGHMPYGIHKHLKGDHIYLMMLRHPVSRVTSLYYYIQALAGAGRQWWVEQGVTIDISLIDFAQLPMCHVHNSMCRQLAGRPFRHEKATAFTRKYFNRALENSGMVKVGLLEAFDFSVFMFVQMLGWPAVRSVHVNEREHPEPTNEEAAIIRRNNKFDLEIYQIYELPF